jgi:hypothetical protein
MPVYQAFQSYSLEPDINVSTTSGHTHAHPPAIPPVSASIPSLLPPLPIHAGPHPKHASSPSHSIHGNPASTSHSFSNGPAFSTHGVKPTAAPQDMFAHRNLSNTFGFRRVHSLAQPIDRPDAIQNTSSGFTSALKVAQKMHPDLFNPHHLLGLAQPSQDNRLSPETSFNSPQPISEQPLTVDPRMITIDPKTIYYNPFESFSVSAMLQVDQNKDLPTTPQSAQFFSAQSHPPTPPTPPPAQKTGTYVAQQNQSPATPMQSPVLTSSSSDNSPLPVEPDHNQPEHLLPDTPSQSSHLDSSGEQNQEENNKQTMDMDVDVEADEVDVSKKEMCQFKTRLRNTQQIAQSSEREEVASVEMSGKT